jgi:hypothetical protein
MVIKERISEGIQGVISECETTVEYLEKVESQFTDSSEAYASSLIKRLVSKKYTGGSVRDHILRMDNVAARLKPLDLAIKDGFLIYLIFNSLPKEFETFEVNYNSMNDKWTLEKFILCVSKRKKGSSTTMVVLIALTWLSTTKRGRIPPSLQEGR